MIPLRAGASTVPEDGGCPIRVLLVDDHVMVTQILQRALSEEPDLDVVAVAGTVEEAVAVVAGVEFDVAVIDYHLPDGDGIEVATLIRSGHPTTKILLLTGSLDDRVLSRALKVRCDGLLTKDRAVTELVTAVRAVAAGQPWLSGAVLGRVLRAAEVAGDNTELTPREIEVIELAAQGMQNAAIAKALFLSVNTVRNHMQSAIAKLGAHSKLEAVSIAVRRGIISYPL